MSKTTQYEQYPRSQFPSQVDNWDNMQDINSVTAPLALAYNNLIQDSKYTEAANYIIAHPELDKILFNAQKFNQLMDGVKATQQFFKDDVKTYIDGLSNSTIGIDDNLSPTDTAADTNTYSITKIFNLLLPEILTEDSTIDVDNLYGDSTDCNKWYFWDESVAKILTNLPPTYPTNYPGMLHVVGRNGIFVQTIYTNGKIFYRSSMDISSWYEIFDYSRLLTITLKASDWTGSSAPYSQSIYVENLRETDNPLVVSMLQDGASTTEQKAYNKAFGFLAAGTNTISDKGIVFKVYKKPAVDITIGLKGV